MEWADHIGKDGVESTCWAEGVETFFSDDVSVGEIVLGLWSVRVGFSTVDVILVFHVVIVVVLILRLWCWRIIDGW